MMKSSNHSLFEPLKVPEPELPKYIENYKLPQNEDKLLTWEFVEKLMSENEFYWINTVNDQKIPHSVPIWGIWYETRVLVDGSPKTKWVMNLMNNPFVTIHVPSPREVCIIEGKARIIEDDDIDNEMWKKLETIYRTKYKSNFGSPYIMINPIKILAWDVPSLERMTKWEFKKNTFI